MAKRPVISAVFSKNFRGFFTNPTGYVFIAIFILACSYFQFSFEDNFFKTNLADLAPLNLVFPFLLLFFIPVLTMNCWAEEKKLGTDEFLLTLPATDFQIVFGKFLAYFAIYAVALLFSLTLVGLIFLLGKPDAGLILSNYVAYLLIGGAMIALGMVGSLLTSNNTIAFILGAVFNALFLLSGGLGNAVGGLNTLLRPIGNFLEKIGFNTQTGLTGQFGELTSGLLTLSGVVFFIGAIIIFLYLNMILLGKRHWNRGQQSSGLRWHFVARVAALLIGLLALNVVLNKFAIRSDLTAEKIHSLSDKTKELVADVKKPILVEAFVSPKVPTSHADTRRGLLETLREFGRLAGDKVQVKVHEIKPNTDQARQARRNHAIRPRPVMSTDSGGTGVQEIFLAAVMSSGADKQIIDYFGPKHPIEYELTRTVSVLGGGGVRKGIGILDTKANVFGNDSPGAPGGNSGAWQLVEELRKQYTVKRVATFDLDPGGIDGVDALVVVSPSSMSQEDMDKLQEYLLGGNPAILLVDPYPAYNIGISPRMLQVQAQAPNFGGQPPPPPAANVGALLRSIGVDFRPDTVAWSSYNPHPQLNTPEEIVFMGEANDNSFADGSEISSGLQEMVAIFPGVIAQAGGAWSTFTPLLKTGNDVTAGTIKWDDMFMWANMFARQPVGQLGPNEYRFKRKATGTPQTIAAQVTGENTTPTATNKVNCIVVSDADFVGNMFYQLRIDQPDNLNFDNVQFFGNCIDALTGDTALVALRKKRQRHRTLTQLDGQYQALEQSVSKKLEELESDAKKSEEAVQAQFEQEIKDIQAQQGVTPEEIMRQVRSANYSHSKALEKEKQRITEEKEEEIVRVSEESEAKINATKSTLQKVALFGPPLIPLIIGGFFLLARRSRENKGANKDRRR